jgi:predicted DNA-binding protein
MIRTQIYLQKDQKKLIELLAQKEDKPEAQVVRELIEIGIRDKEGRHEPAGKALLRLARIGGNGPADASPRIDHYLYGDAQ